MLALFTYPHIDPIAFRIGRLAVHWYGLMYLGGFVLGWLGTRSRARRPYSPITPLQVDDFVFFSALGVIIGGRIGYMLFYFLPMKGLQGFIDDPLVLFKIWQGGMSFHGGLLGVLFALWLFGRRVGQPFFAMTDFVAPWIPPGLGLGRLGNFINGELWGRPTDPNAFWAVMVDGTPRHASQLYEAFLEGVVLFLSLWWFSRKPRPTMAVSGLFLLLYGVFRFAVEFVREPDEGYGYLAFGWVTMGQVLSAPMIVAGVVLLVLAYRVNRMPATNATVP
ncbi:MAG TPA: prolipoprotein diacylglyceryl transferase [Gammaproteobacteria bacterium]|nr:prolipoprotein diacylglyceryl transferase [Gammaproteobacteria bacterium]